MPQGAHHDMSSIQGAAAAATRLRSYLLERIDAYWWAHAADEGVDLRDYTIGLALSVESNLKQAAIAFSLLGGMQNAQSHDLATSVRASGRAYGVPENVPRMQERNTEIRVHTLALLVSLGATLD